MAIQTVKTGAAVNDGTGDDARTAFTKINQNFTNNTHAASRLVGTATGNVMEVGAFGIGGIATSLGSPQNIDELLNVLGKKSQIFRIENNNLALPFSPSLYLATSDTAAIISVSGLLNEVRISRWQEGNEISSFFLRHSANTSVDANGFIKNASPIVKLFADKIECNDEANLQKITFEKLGVGDYLVKGSTGFAQEGWYIEMPKDANGNVLVAVVYEQLDNNDISVKTYAKKFDEETGDVVANTARPRDIPSTRWIDLRLQALPQSDIKPFNNYETAILDA